MYIFRGGCMKKENNITQSVTHTMMLVTNHCWKYVKKNTRSSDMSKVQFNVCSVVYHYPGISQDGISKTLQMDKSSIAKLIFKLIQMGMIERKVNPNDRREYQIYLTKAGKKAVKDTLAIVNEWEASVFGVIGENWKETIMEYLTQFEKAAKEKEFGM